MSSALPTMAFLLHVNSLRHRHSVSHQMVTRVPSVFSVPSVSSVPAVFAQTFGTMRHSCVSLAWLQVFGELQSVVKIIRIV